MPDSDGRKRMYGRMRSLRLYQLGEGSLVRAELESYLDVPLRYNYDKPEKPRRIKGFEVFSLVFSSFSKPKNHTEISRIAGGVSLTTNE